MEQLIELLRQIEELAKVGIDALSGAGEGGGQEGGGEAPTAPEGGGEAPPQGPPA